MRLAQFASICLEMSRGVILSVAVFQAERRISRSPALSRKPYPTATRRPEFDRLRPASL